MPEHRPRLSRPAFAALTAALFSAALTGCGDAGSGGTQAGPVKGKQMSNVGPVKDSGTGSTVAPDTEPPLPPGARDGMKAIDTSKYPLKTETPAKADATKVANPDTTKDAKAAPPADPDKALTDDEKKKREEARTKALAKAGVDTKQPYTGATPTPGATPATTDPTRPVDPKTIDPTKPVDPKVADPTKVVGTDPAKPDPIKVAVVDPTKQPIKVGPVDPNTPSPGELPEHLKADREAIKKFDASKLKVVNGYTEVPYSALAGYDFPTVIAAENGKDKDNRKIPDEVKKLHGKEVVIQGYMMPIDFEDGGTNEFVLTRIIPSCFYCQPPQLNDWIEVKIKDAKRVPYVPDGPILVSGKLEVGEKFEDGFVVSLYRLTGVKVEKAPNP